MNEEVKTPKVTLLSWTNLPLETVYSVWNASKEDGALMTPQAVKENVDPAEVKKLFRAVIAQRIPIGEHIDFVFLFENISISWREQAVRHRIGTKASPERVGADMVIEAIPDLADSSWWSQCFTGDTKVRLLDGTSKTFKELAAAPEQTFWVYSVDTAGKIVPGRAHSARKSKRSRLVEVELDNGERIRSTPDHRFMLRDGTFAQAQTLVPGTSLMPLYTKPDKYGYELVYNPASGRYVYTHKLVDAHLNGPLPKGLVVHHDSFDKRNNDPTKLKRLRELEHMELHARIITERMAADPVGHAERLSKAQKLRWKSLTEPQRDSHRAQLAAARSCIDMDARSLAMTDVLKTLWKDEDYREKMKEASRKAGLASLGRKDSAQARKNKSTAAKLRTAREISNGKSSFNHNVVSVKFLDVEEDVFDITVDVHENFALESGVFVHNSGRIRDAGKFSDNREFRIPETVAARPDSLAVYLDTMNNIQSAYRFMVEDGVPMEDAREVMPLGMQHRMSWKLNIGALQHIVSKRGCQILQLGLWGPIITGMIRELVEKVDPVFAELVSPPCVKGDKFTGCVFQEENRRRYTQEDKLPPCSLHVRKHYLPVIVDEGGGTYPDGSEASDASADALVRSTEGLAMLGIPLAVDVHERAKQYRAFWNRDPFTGERL